MDVDWVGPLLFFLASAIAGAVVLLCKDWIQKQLRHAYSECMDEPPWRSLAHNILVTSVIGYIWRHRKDRRALGVCLMMLGGLSVAVCVLAVMATLYTNGQTGPKSDICVDGGLYFNPEAQSVWLLLSGATTGGGWVLFVRQVSLRSLVTALIVVGLLASVPQLLG